MIVDSNNSCSGSEDLSWFSQLEAVMEIEMLGEDGMTSIGSNELRDENDPEGPLAKRRKTSIAYHIHNVSRRSSVIKVPPIPKDDIRRKYPIMFLNTLNLMDDLLLMRFFDQFIRPGVVLKRQIMTAHDPTLESQSVSFYGAQEAMWFILSLNFFGPDRVFQLESCSIITRSTTYSTQIVLDCAFHMSSLYDWNVLTVQDFIHRQKKALFDEGNARTRDKPFVEWFHHGLRQYFPFSPRPEVIDGHRRLILSIDNYYAREEIDMIQIQIPPF